MKQRTLKEVAQAGLVLGFEWIAANTYFNEDGTIRNREFFLRSGFRKIPCTFSSMCKNCALSGISHSECNHRTLDSVRYGDGFSVQVTDFPDLPPDKSLLELSEIVEGEV